MITRSKYGIYKLKALQVKCDYIVIEPPSFAVASINSQWVATMDVEFQSLQKQKTWLLVPFPHKNIVTCKWVYKLKRNSDGFIARHKARLVAKEYLNLAIWFGL